ncbi:hypothetical protein OROGR_034134 [Orobanche gracilis]
MVVAIIILFVSVVFIFCLHLYAKWYWYRRHENPTASGGVTTTTRRLRSDYQESTLVSASSHGLNPIVLKTLPVVVYDPNEFRDGLKCAVCLCEVSKGEKTRLLPKCNHGFHLDCIDMWFQSHPTCHLCRNPVSNQKELSSGDPLILENSQVRTFNNCLDEEYQNSAIIEPSSSSSSPSSSIVFIDDRFNGVLIIDSSSSSSSSSLMVCIDDDDDDRPNGVLIIDIPQQMNEEEEQKSPIPSRLRSLKKHLSGNRKNNPCRPISLDLEQGYIGQS